MPNEKRELVIDKLLSEGWKANDAYINQYPAHFIADKTRGKIKMGDNYLISKDGEVAVTVKSNVLTVHEKERNFCKGLSMRLNKIEITKVGLKSGKIMLLF